MRSSPRSLLASVTCMGVVGCAPLAERDAQLEVSIYGESYVEDMIPATAFADGWRVEFSTFLVAISELSADDTAVAGAYLFDLTVASAEAGQFVRAIPVASGTTERLSYRIGPVETFDGGNADSSLQDMMVRGGYALYAAGRATRERERVEFAWGFANATTYDDCAIDRDLGVGELGRAQITIHADHPFYDDLESETPNVAFELLAAADVDDDGVVTPGELRGVDIRGQSRYQVGSRAIDDLWEFVSAQTETIGHIDGEGHCEGL